jgi:hypothetical protein
MLSVIKYGVQKPEPVFPKPPIRNNGFLRKENITFDIREGLIKLAPFLANLD